MCLALALYATVQPTPSQPVPLSRVIDYEPAISPDGKRIAFISNRDGRLKLYVMSAEGEGVVRLTDDMGEDDSPAWSPDGTRIAFVSTSHGNTDIFVVNADGSGRKRVTTHSGADIHPNWSPDAKRVLFNSLRHAGDPDRIGLYEIGADGSGERPIAPQVNGSYASWSPDGKAILLRMMFGADSEIAVIDPRGAVVKRLTTNGAFDGWPAWAPDGKRVVFARERGDPADQADIVIVAVDGSSEQVIAGEDGRKTNPRWSPDGSFVVYSRRADRQVRLWRMPAR